MSQVAYSTCYKHQSEYSIKTLNNIKFKTVKSDKSLLNYLIPQSQTLLTSQSIKISKMTQVSTKKYRFQANSEMIPHPKKQYKGGQDAILVKKNLLVIADGVGGWAQHGIDAGLYSKNLCKLVDRVYQSNPSYYIEHPDQLLSISVSHNLIVGSSTILIVTLNQTTGLMKTVYLGDSMMSIYSGQQKFKTHEHCRKFNQPYQVGMQGDNPNICQKDSRLLNVGDILILGSDGIWDNMFDHEIQNYISQKQDMRSLCYYLVQTAFIHSSDSNFNSPFSIKALQNGIQYRGGKPDDISIIAARVVAY